MSRYAFLAALALLASLGASMVRAEPPSQIKKSTFSDSFDIPAGELCDFDYSVEFSITSSVTIFADGRVIGHDVQFVTHTNNDTSFSLSEVDHLQFHFYPSRQRFKIVGLSWHLRTNDGKIVVVQAGQLLFDANTGEIVKATPNLNPDFAGVICPALGGNPDPS